MQRRTGVHGRRHRIILRAWGDPLCYPLEQVILLHVYAHCSYSHQSSFFIDANFINFYWKTNPTNTRLKCISLWTINAIKNYASKSTVQFYIQYINALHSPINSCYKKDIAGISNTYYFALNLWVTNIHVWMHTNFMIQRAKHVFSFYHAHMKCTY